MWHELLCNKYLRGKSLSQVQLKPTDSPFWRGIMLVKQEFFSRGSVVVGNGMGVRFWEDRWLGDNSLTIQYPSLYNIVSHKNVLVANVLNNNLLNIGFRRTLIGNNWWLELVERLIEVSLTTEDDTFLWSLTPNTKFTVKSMYADYMNGHTSFLGKYLSKLKVLLKIKIFMWFLNQKVPLRKIILLGDNGMGVNDVFFVSMMSL